MTKALIYFTSTALLSTCLYADSSTRELSILPVGQHPPTIIEVVGKNEEGSNLTREKEINTKFLPPTALYCIEKNSKEAKIIPLTLNRSSRTISFSTDSELKVLSKPQDGKLIHEFKQSDPNKPETNPAKSSLLLIYPKPGSKNWEDYQTKLLDNDWKSFPVNSIRVINLCANDCGLVLGDSKKVIKAQSSVITTIPQMSEGQDYASFELYTKTAQGGGLRLMNNTVMLTEPQRHTILIYPNMFKLGNKPVIAQKITELPNS